MVRFREVLFKVLLKLVTLLHRMGVDEERLRKWLSFTNCIPAVVEGPSMMPALKPGQVVLVDKKADCIAGDIVAVRHPKADYYIVKRIEQIVVNPTNYPQGTYVSVVGDNLPESIDSRHFGLIPYSLILGRVIA